MDLKRKHKIITCLRCIVLIVLCNVSFAKNTHKNLNYSNKFILFNEAVQLSNGGSITMLETILGIYTNMVKIRFYKLARLN